MEKTSLPQSAKLAIALSLILLGIALVAIGFYIYTRKREGSKYVVKAMDLKSEKKIKESRGTDGTC